MDGSEDRLAQLHDRQTLILNRIQRLEADSCNHDSNCAPLSEPPVLQTEPLRQVGAVKADSVILDDRLQGPCRKESRALFSLNSTVSYRMPLKQKLAWEPSCGVKASHTELSGCHQTTTSEYPPRCAVNASTGIALNSVWTFLSQLSCFAGVTSSFGENALMQKASSTSANPSSWKTQS